MRTRPLVTARYIRSLQLLGWALLALSWLGLGPGCAYARAVLFCCPPVFGLGLALVVIPSLPDLQASQTPLRLREYQTRVRSSTTACQGGEVVPPLEYWGRSPLRTTKLRTTIETLKLTRTAERGPRMTNFRGLQDRV